MSLPRSQGYSVVSSATLRVLVGTVDENVVSSRRWATETTIKGTSTGLESSDVIPVRESVRAKVKIIISRSRAVDLNGTNNAIAVLAREMRVIPSRSVLGGLELIGFSITRSKGA